MLQTGTSPEASIAIQAPGGGGGAPDLGFKAQGLEVYFSPNSSQNPAPVLRAGNLFLEQTRGLFIGG